MRITSTHYYFWRGEFSQWHKSPFVMDGERFNCCEQAMMWSKAMLFGDFVSANKILAETNPREQQALGRKVIGFKQDIWDEKNPAIVARCNIHKFEQNERLRGMLLSTENLILVEASPKDKIWGVGLAEEDDRILDEANWLGENRLGVALMVARKMLSGGNICIMDGRYFFKLNKTNMTLDKIEVNAKNVTQFKGVMQGDLVMFLDITNTEVVASMPLFKVADVKDDALVSETCLLQTVKV